MIKRAQVKGVRSTSPCGIEPLEPRRLFSTWSAQDQLIGLDKAVQNYPAITGAGETVVLIDHGVDYTSAALGGGVGAGHKIIAAYNFTNDTTDVYPYDNDAHGTGSAGQVAGNLREVNGQLYQGVAPGVNLVALRIGSTADAVNALDWVVAHRAEYNIVAVNYVDPSGQVNGQALVPDLQTLRDQSVFVAGPAGNYGPAQAYSFYSHLLYEVGSETLGGGISNFTPRGSAIDLVAPGEGVDITWSYNGQSMDYVSNGTSWAGPQAVGAAALIKQVNSSFTPDQILAILKDSAHWIYDPTSNMSYPALDVNAAIGLAYKRSQPAPVTTPTTTPVTTPVTTPTTPTPPTPTVPTVTPVSTPATESPFTGTPFWVGQTIPAADYDKGGEGLAYHDDSANNEGGDAFRTDNGVDTQYNGVDGGQEFVGWTQAGEWMKYTVNVATAGYYSVSVREASAGAGGSIHFNVDGATSTNATEMPGTGGWNAYATVTAGQVYLTAGQHTIRLNVDTVGSSGYAGNVESFRLDAGGVSPASGGSSGTAASTATLAVVSATSTSLTISWSGEDFSGMTVVLQRTLAGSTKWATMDKVSDGKKKAAATGTYTDRGLSMGKTYDYRLKIVSSRGKAYYQAASGATTTLLGRHHLGHHHALAA